MSLGPRAARSLFRLGAVGGFYAAAVAIPFGVMAFFFIWAPPILYRWWILPVIFSSALLLHSFAFYGLWRYYHTKSSAGAFACGLAAALLMLATGVIASGPCGTYEYPCYRGIPGSTMLVFVVGIVMLGVMSVAEGASFFGIRRFVYVSQEAYGAGVLSVVAGGFLSSIALAFLGGFFVLATSFVLGGAVLIKASPPEGSRKG